MFIGAGLALSATPALLAIYGVVADVSDNTIVGFIAQRPGLAAALAAILSITALLVFEPPRAWSARGYAQQLRARTTSLQHEYETALRSRFPELKESPDDPAPPSSP